MHRRSFALFDIPGIYSTHLLDYRIGLFNKVNNESKSGVKNIRKIAFKILDYNLFGSQRHYEEIDKLNKIRKTLVHFNGEIHEENNGLNKKKGDRIRLSLVESLAHMANILMNGDIAGGRSARYFSLPREFDLEDDLFFKAFLLLGR